MFFHEFADEFLCFVWLFFTSECRQSCLNNSDDYGVFTGFERCEPSKKLLFINGFLHGSMKEERALYIYNSKEKES